ncbi:glycosyltransferase family 2 protein [Lyngbya confervoides]|uniref:Glycosyltransferase family 2 protein n=1 Tax=Lyngbya confervoides BDU141951 TaxID=1574623 RepID=A0ABD4T8L6_9CYAN|nr:glycosyltransferase family 2 protein [Lyngbya confervoides]MCM1984784.1 glycosyltransferase family 2 protein [Lyngbya confervoides BDU141951]
MAPLTYSIVIPIYNEADNLLALHQQLQAVLGPRPDAYEIIFVDDGSRDRSLAILRQLQHHNPNLRYLSFARNFGHQIAVTAGLQFAQGQAVIVMDGDLQDPPTLIPVLIDHWRQGYKVVYAQRRRRDDSWIKQGTAFLFYRLLRQLTEVDIPTDTGDFCLMDRDVVQLLNQMPEKHRYIRGLRAWVGFPQTAVPFDRPNRFAGTAKYTLRKSLSLAISSILAFSTLPLRLSTYLGLFAAGAAIVMAALTLYWRIVQQSDRLIGFTLITIAIFFIGAVQLICIGILGAYIGRIYEEVQGRPLYTLKELNGFPNQPTHLPPQSAH